jgi:MEMO1 family protein
MTTTTQPIVFAALMPHAPILAPGVGRVRHLQVFHTIDAMNQVARRMVAARPDALLVVSPHSPRRPGAYGIWRTPLLRGSLEQFGSGSARIELRLDERLADRLEQEADARGVRTWRIQHGELDHGATVPLAYLTAAGWQGPVVVISLNQSGSDGLEAMGEAIAAAAGALDCRLAVIASGDMSQRLTPASPSGFHADGASFDRAFLELLRAATPVDFNRVDPVLAEHADQDVVDSTHVVLAAAHPPAPHRAVLSYEAPFGVGYGVAVLAEDLDPDPFAAAVAGSKERLVVSHRGDLPRVARAAVVAQFQGGPEEPPFEAGGELALARGVWVRLRELEHRPHGCHGTPTPTQANLVLETWHGARAAAFADPYFPPLREDELRHVQFSVSVASDPEPVATPDELDTALYGVVVSGSRHRRAFLLPGIRNITTVSEQLRLARQKAGLKPGEDMRIERFTLATYQEPEPEENGV